jgi:hypothetical protein
MRQLYEDTIIPEADEWIDAVNGAYQLERYPFHLVARFDHLSIFQENIMERAKALNLLTTSLDRALASEVITVDDYRNELEKMGL